MKQKQDIDIKFSREAKKLPIILTKNEIITIIESIKNTKHKFILSLSYSAGLRVSDVINIKVGDFDLENLSIHIKGGKGEKDRITIFSESLKKNILKLSQLKSGEELLIESERGGILTIRTIQKILNHHYKHMKKILVGLSGGVDSAVSAYLLKKQGYDVTAGFMINYLAPEGEYCPTKDDIEVAKEVAAFLDIPFFTFDYREDYAEKVLGYMYEGYQKGITPNPDIMCNSEVKFRVFLDEALQHGFDGIAMGHYARIVKNLPAVGIPLIKGELKGDIYHLKKGVDANKDQSYFLAGLNQFQLSKALFPIGELEKPDVRKIAIEVGLPNANRKESQGICFVGKVDLTKFLEKKINPKPGKILDTSGKVLGTHNGVFYYTIGQRKGLDLGGQKEPVFIVKKYIEKNEIIVGTTSDLELYDDKLFVKEFHFLSRLDYDFPLSAKCKIRYRQADQDCTIYKENDGYMVEFNDKQRAIASGQICAVYIGDELVMSGVIN